jgi:hypothetical protein
MSQSVVVRLIGVAGLALGLGACASATAVPVDYNSSVPGFRVYDVKPILIVNGQAVSIELIPNYNKAYAMQFTAFLAKNDFTVEMERGFIRKLDGKLDSTKFIDVLTELAKQIPALTGKAMSGTAEGGVQDRFQVYEFIFGDDGSLVGLRPLMNQRDLLHVRTTRLQGATTPAPVLPQPSPGGSGNGPTPGTVQ